MKHGAGKWTIPIVIERKIKGRMIHLAVDGTTQPVAQWWGTVVDDKLEGLGSEQWSNGVEYRGDFKDNMRHGHGRML